MLGSIKKILISNYLLLLTLLNISCSINPNENLSKELKTVSSWAATAHMVGEASIRGTVPTAYAKETLKKSLEKIQQETEKLSKSPEAQEEKVLEPLQQLQQIITQMSIAVEQKDNKEIATQLQRLSRQEKKIRTLEKQVSAKS
ncbi:MAG: hypothetical protein PUP91_01350 [Rhizonema sp. PD37]|nr:hypothetical protein [Rhizonema sp. PD37]